MGRDAAVGVGGPELVWIAVSAPFGWCGRMNLPKGSGRLFLALRFIQPAIAIGNNRYAKPWVDTSSTSLSMPWVGTRSTISRSLLMTVEPLSTSVIADQHG